MKYLDPSGIQYAVLAQKKGQIVTNYDKSDVVVLLLSREEQQLKHMSLRKHLLQW